MNDCNLSVYPGGKKHQGKKSQGEDEDSEDTEDENRTPKCKFKSQ